MTLIIISNPTDVQSVISLGGEGDGLQFHMSGVSEEYVINIYDIHGRIIKSLVGGTHFPGNYQILWDGTNKLGNAVSAGIYLYSLETSTFRSVKQLVLLK